MSDKMYTADSLPAHIIDDMQRRQKERWDRHRQQPSVDDAPPPGYEPEEERRDGGQPRGPTEIDMT
ncbi:MAG: hypothetical protein WCW16_00415 [Candidatus Magasanikbacteria bacterium]